MPNENETDHGIEKLQPTAEEMVSQAQPQKILPFEDISSSPEPYWAWYRPFGLLFLVIVSLVIFIIGLLLVPFVIIGTLYHRYKVGKLKYHTNPKDVKVAVIGGGWGGLQTTQRLLELGVTDIEAFERFDDMGGCWHGKVRYHGQQVHGPMWITSFNRFPYSQEKRSQDAKIRGDEFHDYMRRFVDQYDLRKYFTFNANVKEIHQDSKKLKATLEIELNNNPESMQTRGPFDLVIYTSVSSDPYIPTFKGQDTFEGKIIHAQNLKAGVLQDIVETKKKVAILGGGKMAIDVVAIFQALGYDELSWIYRHAYLFFKFENFLGPGKGCSLPHILLGFNNLLYFTCAAVSSRLSRWILWCSGVAWTYDGSPPMDATKCKLGQVCPNQRRLLNQMDRREMYKSGIAELQPKGALLHDGRFVPMDVLLLGTSCTSGVEHLRFFKDGDEVDLPGLNNGTGPKMLNYFTLQEMPTIAFSNAIIISFGPIRNTGAAELAVYHTCVQKRHLTPHEMQRISRWQIGGKCKSNSTSIFVLFDRETNFSKEFVRMLIGAVLSGLLDFGGVLVHIVSLFCFGKQDHHPMDVIPRKPYDGDT